MISCYAMLFLQSNSQHVGEKRLFQAMEVVDSKREGAMVVSSW
jgi:hypothetical protein